MTSKDYAAWMRAGMDAWTLGMEASMVIGLRMSRFATGADTGGTEAKLMVAEKMQALAELQMGMMTGKFGTTALSGTKGALRHYGRKVSANRKRLSR